MMPICFVDTETTGLHQDKQLWEVAIIRREFDVPSRNEYGQDFTKAVVETRYESFVPVDLSNADLFGLNVGKFYERHPYGRYQSGRDDERGRMPSTTFDIAHQIARFTHGCRFIGAAPSFDAEVLGDFLRKHGLLPTWHHRLVDTHDLLTGYLIGRWHNPQNVMEMSKDEKEAPLNIGPLTADFAHTAMGDAQHEADIWDAVMG